MDKKLVKFKELKEKTYQTKEGEEKKKYFFVAEEMSSSYVNTIAFEIFGDSKIEQLVTNRHYEKGEMYEVFVNLRSNYSEKTDNYFQSISAWKINKQTSEKIDDHQPEPQVQNAEDDLPF